MVAHQYDRAQSSAANKFFAGNEACSFLRLYPSLSLIVSKSICRSWKSEYEVDCHGVEKENSESGFG